MGGFLNYLDDFDERSEKVTRHIIKKEPVEIREAEKKSKVLCLNVEVRSVEGAKIVIDKLFDWISKNGMVNETEEKVEVKEVKKNFTIPPKKVVKNPIRESISRAMDILDGLPDEDVIEPTIMSEHNQQSAINTPKASIPKENLDSVAGHASALL